MPVTQAGHPAVAWGLDTGSGSPKLAGMSADSASLAAPALAARRERGIGLACALGVLAIWTGFILSARLATQQSLLPWDLAALRYLGSLPVGLAMAAAFGLPRLPWRRTLALMATAAFGFPFAAYVGTRYAPAAHGGVLMTGLLPFATALLAALVLGEGWSRRRLLSLGVVGLGIGLLALGSLGLHPGAWRGDLIFLLGCLSWAAFTVMLRLWRVPAPAAATILALYPPLLYLPPWLLLRGLPFEGVGGLTLAYHLVYQGVLAVAVAGFLFTRAVTALGGATTTTITALVPALAALLAWPLLGEPLGAAGLLGVVLVSAGMMLGVLGGER